MSQESPLVVLLPGLGADQRLFARQREAFPDILTPAWLPPDPKEDLPSYAARFVATLPKRRPLVLGGCSFGGMTAYEMSRIVRPDALVLIGSASTRCGIPLHLRMLASLAPRIPAATFRLIHGVASPLASVCSLNDEEDRQVFADMLRATPREFLKWACTALWRWHPTPLAGVPIFTIHGDKDRMLPLRRRTADVVVENGGHLLPLTHAVEVNELLRTVISRVACGDRPN